MREVMPFGNRVRVQVRRVQLREEGEHRHQRVHGQPRVQGELLHYVL